MLWRQHSALRIALFRSRIARFHPGRHLCLSYSLCTNLLTETPLTNTSQIGLFCKTAIPPCLCEWQIATARASPASSCNDPFKPSMDMTIRATWSFDAPPKPVSPCLTALGEYSKTGTPADAQTAITTPLTCPRIIAVLAFLKKKPPSRAAASGWVRPISDAVLS